MKGQPSTQATSDLPIAWQIASDGNVIQIQKAICQATF